MKMAGIVNYLKLKVALPAIASLSIIFSPHNSTSYHKSDSEVSIEKVEDDSRELNSMIQFLEERVIEIRKSRIREIIPKSSRYIDSLFVYSNREGVNPEEIAAMFNVESGWDNYAVSQRGAAGIPQLMPQKAYELGLWPIYKYDEYIENEKMFSEGKITISERDNFISNYVKELKSLNDKSIDARFDPYLSMSAGIVLKGELSNRYRNPDMAHAAYNAGSGAVDNWVDDGWNGSDMGIPYGETRNYVKKVNLTIDELRLYL